MGAMATTISTLCPALLLVAALGCGSPGDADTSASADSSGATAMGTDAGSGSSGEQTTGAPACTTEPLTDEQIGKLAFDAFGNAIAAQPGDVIPLALGLLECCTTLEPVEVCASYSLEPAEGATYDAAAGTLTISADTPTGTTFVLSADVEDGRATVTAQISVYTPEANPLVGVFHEIGQIPCKGNDAEIPPEPVLNELWFHSDGTFSATWEPFETYFDYWGTYTHDVASGALDLKVDGGNYVPPDVDGAGSFRFDGEQLVLEDIWLGSAQAFTGKPACGHRLEQ